MNGDFAVIFTGGDAPPPERCRRIAGGARFVVAADGGLLACEAAGFTPCVIIGDMDSLEEAGESGRLARYPPEAVLRFPRAKDWTDTELALNFLRERGESRVKLIGGGGGRLDHLWGITALFERAAPPESWHTGGEDIYVVEERFEIECGADAAVSVFPAGAGPWKAASTGLRWQLDALKWTRGTPSLRNEAPSGRFTLNVTQGRFAVIVSSVCK